MLGGVLAGLACGLLWGLTFVGPRAVEPFSAYDLTVLRYGLAGLVSLGVMAVLPRYRPTGLGRRRLLLGLLLGALCYNGYFLLIAFAVRNGGAAIPPLIVGTMPVVLAVLGNWNDRTIAWDRLALPLALVMVGVLAVNVEPLLGGGPSSIRNLPLGILFSVAALGSWVVYGLLNGAVMRAPDAPDSITWTCVQGLGCLLGSIAVLPLTGLADHTAPAWTATTAEVTAFLAWGVVLGIAGSWFAALAWVVAARRLPVAFAAQLVVSETVFGLIFGFIFEGRWPTLGETLGIALQIVGVVAAIAVFGRREAEVRGALAS